MLSLAKESRRASTAVRRKKLRDTIRRTQLLVCQAIRGRISEETNIVLSTGDTRSKFLVNRRHVRIVKKSRTGEAAQTNGACRVFFDAAMDESPAADFGIVSLTGKKSVLTADQEADGL